MRLPKEPTQPSETESTLLTHGIHLQKWENILTIPDSPATFSEAEITLQRKLRFTYTKESGSNQTLSQVFVSNQTDFFGLCQYLPFLFKTSTFFLCPSRLIQERISSLEKRAFSHTDNQVRQTLDRLLSLSARQKASDIHLESLTTTKRVRIRVNGKLNTVMAEKRIDSDLFSLIKLISGMDISKTRTPQDGHFPYVSEANVRYDCRTSTIPGVNGEKIVVRLLPSSTTRLSMSDIGFPTSSVPIIQSCLSKKTGMIIFTGPTGSGKTTSLYAILNELTSETTNIMTIEDPVEYRLDNITQVEVNTQAGITFSSALRHFLRQDPDVILVGEIRDKETATIAAMAAQTGHLVLTTLHSNNVFEAIHRMKTLGVSGDDIATSLKLVVSQRLLTRICACSNRSNCPHCFGTGALGRVPIMETLGISPSIKKMLSREKTVSEIERQAEIEKFVPLRSAGEKMVARRVISALELNSVIPK